MIKLKDLLNEGKYTVYFDVGSPGLMSKTVSARNEKEAAKLVASGLKGGAKLIKKVVKEGTGLTYKKGKTVKVKHKTSGREIVIIDKPNVRKEYEKIGYYAESVNEGYRKAKDEGGVRIAQAIHNNVDGIYELVIKDGKDPKEVMRAFEGPLKNSIKAGIKHKYKPHPKADGADVKIKTFQSELKKFQKIADAVASKPSKAAIKRMKDAYRTIWNHKFGAEIALGGKLYPTIIESINERRQYRSGGQEMNFIVQQLVKYGNTKSDAIKMTQKHYNNVLKRYKEPWFIHPVKKAEIISSLSANESVNEDVYYGYYKDKKVKVNAKSDKDAKKQIISKLKIPKGDLERASMTNHTKNQKNRHKFESVSEKLAMGDEYVGTARLGDGRQVMLYRSNEADKWSIGKKHGIKKWDYYLLVKGKGADYIVDTGTKILSKAGKWAQGYIQRKLSGTGKERFS